MNTRAVNICYTFCNVFGTFRYFRKARQDIARLVQQLADAQQELTSTLSGTASSGASRCDSELTEPTEAMSAAPARIGDGVHDSLSISEVTPMDSDLGDSTNGSIAARRDQAALADGEVHCETGEVAAAAPCMKYVSPSTLLRGGQGMCCRCFHGFHSVVCQRPLYFESVLFQHVVVRKTLSLMIARLL